MKFEKINENKIKITLTASDLKDYNITPETLTLNAEGAQDFLHTLLRRAEDFGFYANGEQIMIEAVSSSRDDNFTVYVTKIQNPADAMPHMALRAKRQERARRTAQKRGTLIFRFDDFDEVERASRYIDAEFVSKSTLYKYKDKYYLLIILKTPAASDMFRTKLSDYAREETAVLEKQGELAEHGELMIENDAIGVIRCYFK